MEYLKPEAAGVQNHIAVICCGGLNAEDRILWDRSSLEPYALYSLDGKPIDRMFGGFIFNSYRTTISKRMLHPMFIGFHRPPRRRHWKQWIDDLFAPGYNLSALAELAYYSMHDVWISLPYPHPIQQQFGNVRDRELDFQQDTDRLEALDWWIDRFITRWDDEQGLRGKLTLRGFLWPKEAILSKDEVLVTELNTLIHEKYGKKSMWLPNYGSHGVIHWKNYGFDIAAINPNYYGNNSYGAEWITHASGFAKVYQMGMQLNIGRGFAFSDDHAENYFNLGLEEHLQYMQKSLLVYQMYGETVDQMWKADPRRYIQLYSFIKGIYRK